MAEGKVRRFWTLITIFLVVIILSGGLVAWLRYHPEQPVEISLPRSQEFQGRVYVGGAVVNPGLYFFTNDDTIEALIRAAGDATASANISELRLYVTGAGEGQEPQKIDINRAEVWLLEALPGIGETLARRIVDYREQNGPFLNTGELLKVAGIGDTVYEQIKYLITVADQ